MPFLKERNTMKKYNKIKYKSVQDELDYIEKHSSKIPNRKKLFIEQLETRGWTDADTWSLDHSLAKWITPRLKRFKEVTNCSPSTLKEKQWNAILQKMIDAFEMISHDNYFMLTDKKKLKKVNAGLDLFRKYFMSLWW